MTAINEIKPRTEFGYLRVENQGESDHRGVARYWCVCQAPGCGKRVLIRGQRLRAGQRSCGCKRSVPEVVFAWHVWDGALVTCNRPKPCDYCKDGRPRVDADGNLPEPKR